MKYLNIGVGEPWAGQFILCGKEDAILNEPKVSDDEENFGAEEPIGSKKKQWRTNILE